MQDTHYANIEGKMGQKSRRQAEVCRGRGRGQQTANEEVERRINGIEGTVMTMLYFDFADGPLFDQGHDASTTPKKQSRDAVVMSDLREMVVDTAGAKSLFTVGKHGGEDYGMNLRQDKGNLRGIAMTVALVMNCMTVTDRQRRWPRESVRTPSEARSAAERRCYGCCGDLDYVSVARKGTHTRLIEVDTMENVDAPRLGKGIRVATSITSSISRWTWARRHLGIATLRRTLGREIAP